MKRRIDLVLVERGLAESRHKAQALLLAGQVLVADQKVEKPGQLIDAQAEIRILRQLPFASRAGAKLQAALDHFQILCFRTVPKPCTHLTSERACWPGDFALIRE
jgi:predicted rRNA methylase YqxC with S4 and FtsJ domains